MKLEELIEYAKEVDAKAWSDGWRPDKLIEEVKADDDYTWNNDYWWVKTTGEYGVTKPRSFGPRGMHSSTDGRPLSFEANYTFWEKEKVVCVRTREDAIRLSAAIVLYNMMCSFSRLKINADSAMRGGW